MKSHDKTYITTIVINGQTVFKGRANEQERATIFDIANELLFNRKQASKAGK